MRIDSDTRSSIWNWLKDNSSGLLVVAAIIGSMQLFHSSIVSRMDERFEAQNRLITQHFDAQDKYMNARFNAVGQRFDSIERRLESVETEVQGISERVAYNEGRVDAFAHRNALLAEGNE